jgi:hypothetical protein
VCPTGVDHRQREDFIENASVNKYLPGQLLELTHPLHRKTIIKQ